MRAFLRASFSAALFVAACTDGPEQIFTPNTGDPHQQNGYSPGNPWVAGTEKGYDKGAGGDSVGRARFCDEATTMAQIQTMVTAPIIPDTSVGTVPLWGADGKPLLADSILGKPEDGKFCDPTEVYANAFTWGPTQEVIVFFNQDTHLIESVVAYTQYLGALEGDYTKDGQRVHVVVKPRERISIGGHELDVYTSSAEQAAKTNAWLNHVNVTAVYAMIRETFFGASPFPADFDCVREKICDLVYTAGSESTPQDTFIVLRDSGIQVRVSPDGHAYFVYVEPVRAAPFEATGTIAFAAAPEDTTMSFRYASTTRANCQINLDEAMTFSTFKSRCIDAGDMRTLSRVSYAVDDGRDGVDVQFNGIDLDFLHDTTTKAVLRDGQQPDDDDVLYSVGFTRVLNAPVDEFRPRTLGNLYKRNLEQRLQDAIIADGPIPRDMHPLALYSVAVPFIFNGPQAIGELQTSGKTNWVTSVTEEVTALYHSLSPEEQAMVDPRIVEPVFLLEPFVDAVLEVFSHGESNRADAFKVFRTTDDKRWSIGYAHFMRGGVPYRVQAQYSLNYGAVSAVFVERGHSEVDRILDGVNQALTGGSAPFYTIDLSRTDGNPYGLNGDGIIVSSFDRQLKTVTATLTTLTPMGDAGSTVLTVPGDPIQDRNGYLKQISGERYEFVPADVVKLYGKESSMVFYVESDGLIGRVDQNLFKGSVELCPGLMITYGDNVKSAVTAWAKTASPADYRTCDIVYDYSSNGNVLDYVASLGNRVQFTVVDGRAVTATIWR